MQVDQSTHLAIQDAAAFGCVSFAAAASVVTAAAQNVPPSALATTTTGALGALVLRPAVVLTAMRVQFTGDAANASGQTITVQLLVNGVAHAAGVISALATTAGSKTGSVDFASSPKALSAGDIVRVTITPSATLDAVLTNVMVAVG